MDVLVGSEPTEKPAPPWAFFPVAAWLAALMALMLVAGWMAATDHFDHLAVRADLARLQQVVTELDRAVQGGESYMFTEPIGELTTLVQSPATDGDPEVMTVWDRIASVVIDASTVDRSDPDAMRALVAELRRAQGDLARLVP